MRLATPASSWGRFVTEVLAKDTEANAPLDDGEESEAGTIVSRASAMTDALVSAARVYREESGFAPRAVPEGFW